MGKMAAILNTLWFFHNKIFALIFANNNNTALFVTFIQGVEIHNMYKTVKYSIYFW